MSVSCTVLYCTVLYCAVLYCTVLYCAGPGAEGAGECELRESGEDLAHEQPPAAATEQLQLQEALRGVVVSVIIQFIQTIKVKFMLKI